MGDPIWRWWFRTRCEHIADGRFTEPDERGVQEFVVVLCRRRRWHGGECRP